LFLKTALSSISQHEMSILLTLLSFTKVNAQVQCFTGGCVHQTGSTIYWSGKLDVDVDGAARAYNPSDTGIDYLSDAGSPGDWYGLYTSGGDPVIQGSSDPQPGYYVSTTSGYSSKVGSATQCHYIDAEFVSFLVMPGVSSSSALREAANFKIGDFALVYYAHTGKMAYTFYGDAGPTSNIGEGSLNLLTTLGYNVWNSAHTRCVAGIDSGVLQLLFPGSGFGLGYVPTNRDTNAHAMGAFVAAGGCALLQNILGSPVSGCSQTSAFLTASLDYNCSNAYGIRQSCNGGVGACSSAAVCGGWGGTWSATGSCSGPSNIGCCSVSGYDNVDAAATDTVAPASPTTPWAPPSGPTCQYKGLVGTCTVACPGGVQRSSHVGATGCKLFNSTVLCCLSSSDLVGDVPSPALSSSSTPSQLPLIIGVAAAAVAAIVLAAAVGVYCFLRLRKVPLPASGQGAEIEFVQN
jgi:hypothetical protein